MKIAVYTIAKNEEKFVERWAKSCEEADYRLIVDTGSSDNTLLTAAKYGIEVGSISISPWRFDDARNAALALLPDDIDMCIALDMDEILVPGWRKELEKINYLMPTHISHSSVYIYNMNLRIQIPFHQSLPILENRILYISHLYILFET